MIFKLCFQEVQQLLNHFHVLKIKIQHDSCANHLDRPLVAGCSICHKPPPPQRGQVGHGPKKSKNTLNECFEKWFVSFWVLVDITLMYV